MHSKIGDFAENKEIAKKLRVESIMPSLSMGDEVILDFDKVDGATQSFIHSLVSEPIRQLGDKTFNNLYFKNTNEDIKKIVTIVYRYMQESLGRDTDTNSDIQ
jgi:hypothetical protein